MAIPGMDAQKCQQRNRVAARRDGIDAAPMRLFRDAEGLFRDAPEAASGGVKTRGYLPTTAAGILARINALRPSDSQPLTADQVYWHFAEAANGNFVSDRYMFLDKSTLQNIATDAEAGFAFMNSHRTGGLSSPAEMPFGRTFGGQFQEWTDDTGQPQQRAIVGVYMLRGIEPNGEQGPTTDALHAMIDGGTVSDVSVGLYGGDRICDVCGNELYAYDRDSGGYLCPHGPGTHRAMSPDQQAAQKARGVPDGAATYSLVDARCGEVSAVFDGAVPGAGFRKTLALSRRHDLSEGEATEAKRAYATLLSKGDFQMDEELEERAEGIVTRALAKLGVRPKRGEALGAEGDPDPAPHPVLAAALAVGVDTPEKFAALHEQAALGTDYLAEMREQAQAEAVRLFGAEKVGDRLTALETATFAQAREKRDEYRQIADEKYGTSANAPANRKSLPTALPNQAEREDGGSQDEQLASEAREIVSRTRGKKARAAA